MPDEIKNEPVIPDINTSDDSLGHKTVAPLIHNPAESFHLNKIEKAFMESDGVISGSVEESVNHPVQISKPKSHAGKRKRIITSLVLSSFITLFGGGWLVYAIYQNPDNVVTSAIAKAFSSESILTVGSLSQGSQLRTDFKTQFSHKDGYDGFVELSIDPSGDEATKVIAQVAGQVDGDAYFRIKNIETVLNGLLEPYSALGQSNQLIGTIIDSYKAQFQPIIDGLDGKWVKYGTAEIRKTNEAQATAFECTQDAVKGLSGDTGQLLELGVIYQKNRIILSKESLGVVDGNSGYVVYIDQKAVKKFNEAFKTTKLSKDLRACSKNGKDTYGLDEDLSKNTSEMVIQVWVDQWTHQLKKVIIQDEKNDLSVKIDFVFDAPVSVTTPGETVPYDEVYSEVNSLLKIFGL